VKTETVTCDRCLCDVNESELRRIVVETVENLPRLLHRWDVCPECVEAISAGFAPLNR
jgi:hypothetical protein